MAVEGLRAGVGFWREAASRSPLARGLWSALSSVSGVWAMGWRSSMADWGGGMSASCKPRVELFADASNGWPHSALRYHWLMPSSCHFRECKALLVASLTHVRSAIATTRPLSLWRSPSRQELRCFLCSPATSTFRPLPDTDDRSSHNYTLPLQNITDRMKTDKGAHRSRQTAAMST